MQSQTWLCAPSREARAESGGRWNPRANAGCRHRGVAHSVKIGTGVIDHGSDHRALRRPDGSTLLQVRLKLWSRGRRVRNDDDEEAD